MRCLVLGLMMSLTGYSLRRRASFAFALTFGLVALGDWLLYEHPWGINVALFGAALLAAVLLRDDQAVKRWPGRVLTAACIGLIVALAIEPGPLPIALGMLGLVSLAIVDRGGWSSGAAVWLWGVVRFAGQAIAQPFRDARTQQRWQRSRGVRYPMLIAVVRWVIPVVLSLVFVGLFALANPIISGWTDDLPQLLAPLRIALWLGIGLAVWGLLRVRLRRRRLVTVIYRPLGLGEIERNTGSTWITRSLILFNSVFAVQTVLDAIYLYGGAALPDGMTYAQYAHRGAYPLIATALLAGLFVWVTFRPGGLAERSAWARRLVFLWIAQNVLLVVSSVWRLSLYVDVYSLTRWRVAAGVWMALVAVALILLVARIVLRLDNRWLVQANTLAAAAVLYACCFVGFDGLIADYNVRHCREVVVKAHPTGDLLNAELDLDYLEALGPDALPALHRYIAAIRGEPAYRAEGLKAAHLMDTLERELNQQLDGWRGWTLRRATLAQGALGSR